MNRAFIQDENDLFANHMKKIHSVPPTSSKEIYNMFNKLERAKKNKKATKHIRERIYECNLGIVINRAMKLFKLIRYSSDSHLQLMDLIQSGNLALVRAVDTFDVIKGNTFCTYAIPIIDREIRELIRTDKFIYIPKQHYPCRKEISKLREEYGEEISVDFIAKKLEKTEDFIEMVIEGEKVKAINDRCEIGECGSMIDNYHGDYKNQKNAEMKLFREDVRKIMFKECKSLSKQESSYIKDMYLRRKNIGMQQIAKKHHITHQYVSIIIKRAIDKLKKRFAISGVLTREDLEVLTEWD